MTFSKPIHRLRSDAKLLARENKIPLNQAQDNVAKSEGFNGWSHLASEWHKAQQLPFDWFVKNKRDKFRIAEAISWPETDYRAERKPCAFCGETEALSFAEDDPWQLAIYCDNCGAKAPDGESEGEAYHVWNIRTKSCYPDACPFCGEIADTDGIPDALHCGKCGAKGPSLHLVENDDDFPEKDAASLWRRRRPDRG